ncbi:DUF2927 domain-containing protein [Shimia sp. R10_1]|uniref:DUF2927 domain-containing protein n=1 Tax=Shimia sp. R10_1 TaxID=2821095 RepID=UPI001ADC6C22|nr:DUF2927 domain-containing protein [Shimia sp. R10_1]MBO9472622.1 DUF2927 domain-containing protein [Shimia sp. R10_1]
MFRFFLPVVSVLGALALGACTPLNQSNTSTRAAVADTTLPPVKGFATPRPKAPARSNRDIARDFLDLTFELESGRKLERLTRFEGPITVRVTGTPPPGMMTDLRALLARLRSEARINISLNNTPNANITIQAVSRKDIRKALPQAACFVVPNISSLSQYRGARRSGAANWALLENREKIAIFLPNDTSPQETRDCLHEELAQALGPLNDLYRLPDSVFNDDNIHAVLTGFDMTILRAFYDPMLANGMSRNQVANRLPAILSRINPRGDQLSSNPLPATPRSWIDAVQTALGPGTTPAGRRVAARQALLIAQSEGWRDHRLGFSHYALGRLLQSQDISAALSEFRAADRAYRSTDGLGPHRAFVATQLSAYAISAGQSREALKIISPQLTTAAEFENAALLSTLMLLQAEALDMEGQLEDAANLRLDSLGWARYGFGPDWAVRAKLREIATLSPIKGGS